MEIYFAPVIGASRLSLFRLSMFCALILGGAGCTDPVRPLMEFYLLEQEAPCRDPARDCKPDPGLTPPEKYQVAMKLSRRQSTLAPNGLLVSIGFVRPGGITAELVLDLPINRSGAAADRPLIQYTERRGGEMSFRASHAGGRVELGLSRGCPCQTGRLELVLMDPGEDGVLDTEDDQTRRISQARLRFDGRPFCHQRSALEVKEDLVVMGFRTCPAQRTAASGGGEGSFAWDQWGRAESSWNEEQWYDEHWVGEEPADWEYFEPWDGEDCDQCDFWEDSTEGEGWRSEGDSGWDDWDDSGWDDWDDSGWDDWDDSGWDDWDDSGWDDWDDSGWDDWDDSGWDDWDDSGWDDWDDSGWDDSDGDDWDDWDDSGWDYD